MRSGKHPALVGLSTGEDISGSALTLSPEDGGSDPASMSLIRKIALASFHTGKTSVAYFLRRVKDWFRPPPRIVILPQAMSFEAWDNMRMGEDVAELADEVLKQIDFVPIADAWRYFELADGTKIQVGVIAEAVALPAFDEPLRK